MIISAIQQVQNDAQAIESLASSYSQGWDDVVSERVFDAISSLASNASGVASQLYAQGSILQGIESQLTQLAQF